MMTDEEFVRTVSQNVRRQLERLQMSQRQLSRATGDSAMTINDLVNGRCMPGAGLLARVAEGIGMSIESLIFGRSPRARRARERAR